MSVKNVGKKVLVGAMLVSGLGLVVGCSQDEHITEKTLGGDSTVVKEIEKVDVEKTKELGVDEWWTVDNQWRLKIDSVRFTDERNERSDKNPEEVIVVKYTYENLGYEGDSQDLFMTPDNLIDSAGKVSDSYPAGSNVTAKTTPIGAMTEGAEESYGVSSSEGEVKVMFQQYDNSSNMQKATFIVPLNKTNQ